MKKVLSNRRGETYATTAVTVIIAVVVGTLILGGVVALVQGVIIPKMNEKIVSDINFGSDVTMRASAGNPASSIGYSYDGEQWFASEMPEFSENASILRTASNGSTDAPATTIFIKDGSNIVSIYSVDGGKTYRESTRWHYDSIFSTSVSWVSGNNRFEAIVRIDDIGYYLYSVDGSSWKWKEPPRVYF